MARGYGEGSIFQLRGKWCGQISLGFDKENKRDRRTVYGKNKRDVQDQLLKLMQDHRDGRLVDASRDTVGEFLKRWLDVCIRVDREPKTYEGYEVIVRRHIEPFIGNMLVQKLTPLAIQTLLSQLEKEGRSDRIRQLVYQVLHVSLNQAVEWNVLALNPADRVKKPKQRRDPIQIIRPDELAVFLDAAKPDRLYPLYLLAIGSGMRLGEILGLKWTEVDFERRTVTIVRQGQEVMGRQIVKDTKTAAGRRTIELPKSVIDGLKAHRESQAGRADWVFTDTNGNMIRRSNFYRDSLKPTLKRANMAELTFHGLRHSHATMLLQAGVHPKIVAERLGHDVTMTLKIYSHVIPSLQREAAGKVEEMLGQAQEKATEIEKARILAIETAPEPPVTPLPANWHANCSKSLPQIGPRAIPTTSTTPARNSSTCWRARACCDTDRTPRPSVLVTSCRARPDRTGPTRYGTPAPSPWCTSP